MARSCETPYHRGHSAAAPCQMLPTEARSRGRSLRRALILNYFRTWKQLASGE
jgi:hypothetical protein